jgi:type II secretory pathway pseudopilin PulG
MKNQRGISLVVLIITIIVIIILAGIVISNAIDTPDRARLAVFRSDMDSLEQAVGISYADLVGDYAEEGTQKLDSKIYAEVATGNSDASYQNVVFPDAVRSLVFINDSHKIKNISGLPEYKDGDGNNQQYAVDPLDGSVYLIPGFKYKGEYYYSVSSEGELTAAYIE